MTLEDKIEHFRRMSLESANTQSEQSLQGYKQSLDNDLETYKDSARLLAEESKKARMNQAKAEATKKLSSSQLSARKALNSKQAEIKSKVFDEVRARLSSYRNSSEYLGFLTSQIENIKEKYSGYDFTVYIDPDDSLLLEKLRATTSVNIKLNEKEFSGGIRTVIPAKNILIDDSFKTKLSDEQEQFTVQL